MGVWRKEGGVEDGEGRKVSRLWRKESRVEKGGKEGRK